MPDCSRPASAALSADSATTTTVTPARRDDPLRGILLVVVAVFFFSCSDATAKYLSQTLPSIEIGWMRYVAFSTLLLPLMLRGGPQVVRTARPGLQILRGLGMLGSALFFIMGMRYLPLAEAAATSYVSPVFVTILSILILNEKIGVRRWAAVLVGLVGVLIVIRPGGAAFQPAAVFPILSAMSWATGVVMTRKMTGQERPATTLIWTALTGLAVLTALLPFDFAVPTWREVALGGLIGVVSTIAQWLLVQAYRYGDASVLASYSYIQIVWSSMMGYLVFGAMPDHWTFVGAGVIIASGVYTAHRERIRQKERAASQAPAAA
ncbi:DMT family transporter [Azospirillum rugosum]|uniref:Drug/metabolite transporter (DMT)-like permease n=1 Tax=Azospirillum rugosum TaxID=416170 RepID=A0ABS4SF34_9PROT|nr:DMT family transporter [Azospirillum rugosum]MBP2290678.1 drug/metabolite transporter (DMT)-like permease [Azospirillum rugosum]MDQ0525566.1 drug/metabolite transporter (DMT)-like permease [Azospirillum rugosum]